jgi:CBS-domain-containing membrane protein
MWECCRRLWWFLGIEPEGVSWAERAVSTLGGFLGIGATALVSFKVSGASGAALIVPSMGASSVLLFAVPHGRLSQPWSLFGGHLVSAAMGVACQQLVPDMFVAAGLAVGLAIGGPAIHGLGFGYMLSPILVNTVVIFLIAFVFNNIFPWRRYPASLMRFTDAAPGVQEQAARLINKHCIEKAIQDMDLIVDTTTDDLQRLFTLTLEHAEAMRMTPEQIQLGRYYTHGRRGADWSVRQIIDESRSRDPEHDMVVYRVVDGRGLRSADSCTRREFARWAEQEVFPNQPENP